ncbi:MAG TPA: S8 family peptidase [Actinoplanes sp.]|nr:S8 family peptidase [Actinoplanes sp.]
MIRKFAAGAVAAGALAAVGVFASPAGTADWTPVSYGVTAEPESIVPAIVTAAQPARIVTTTLDADGRPVVKVEEATDKATAVKLIRSGQRADDAVGVELDAPVYALGVPAGSDTYRAQQWDLGKIRATDAWQRTTGAGVTVAVIDSGVDAGHPDLAGHVLSGYDALTGKEGPTTDVHGHGTHVAGTIAAVAGNEIGVAGIAPDVKILPVKVLSDSGSGNMSDTAEGIVWAADHGAQVINMSLGGTTKVTAVSNAVKYARSKGVTVVAAAGNSRREGSPTAYPAADAGVIAVAATDSSDQVGFYSNAGTYVDVAAPGTGIVSTYPAAKGSYKSMSGTSMAAPHVAAVAGLLKSLNSALTPDQIESALKKSAVDLGPKGADTDFGSGRIDAVAALDAAAPVAKPAPSVSTGKIKLDITANVSAAEVVYGTSTTTRFTVKSGGQAWAGKQVELCVTEAGADPECSRTWTGPNGMAQLTRAANASYQVVLKAEGNVSAPAGYRVKAAVMLFKSGEGELTLSVTGATGQDVDIQQAVGGDWQSVATWTVPGSPARITINGVTAGESYRVVVPDTDEVGGVTSSPIVA